MHIQAWWHATAVCLVMVAPTGLHAAGGAYVVDDAAIGKPGECQIESWVSHASNSQFIGTTQPACVARLGIPVEFTASFAATRSDAWTTFTGVQAKVVPLETSRMAIAFSASTVLDVTNGQSTASYLNAPVTIKVNDQFRLNVNGGVLWNDSAHFTWGAGFEWGLSQSWTLIAEVFGQTGNSEDPRFQAGARYAPTKSMDIDIIYGHNVTGENAHWLTAGLTMRF